MKPQKAYNYIFPKSDIVLISSSNGSFPFPVVIAYNPLKCLSDKVFTAQAVKLFRAFGSVSKYIKRECQVFL